MRESDSNSRLDPHPSQITDRSRTVGFKFDGSPVQAYEGDTIASALSAAGISILSRSFKYHRPRGLLCVAGRCPNCLMNVDDTPNVRICTEPVRDGMKVRHQNAWPSLENDALAVLDKMDKLMPVGFYYKTFHRPKLFWHMSQPIIRRIAGLGEIDVNTVPDTHYHHQNSHADVAIVGGGAAGISAALAAANEGARVTLIDDQPSLGGHLRFDSRSYTDIPGISSGQGFEIAKSLSDSAQATRNIQIMNNATAFGLYQDNLLGVLSGKLLTRLRAKQVVMATGSYEVPLTFQRNDLPGVILSTGGQRLQHLYGVKLGATAVVATTTDHGYYAALDMLNAGIRIATVADARPHFPETLDAANELKSRGVLVLNAHAIVRAEGKKRVSAAVLRGFQNASPVGTERRFDCDFICMSGGFQPASFLLQQVGSQMSFDVALGESVPGQLPPTLYAAGEITGIHDLRASVLQGRIAGLEAAADLGQPSSDAETSMDELRRELATAEEEYRQKVNFTAPLAASDRDNKAFVCFCEDITAKDISDAIGEGFDDIQTLKRYSTVTMGPCQGKMCLKAFVDISAQRIRRSIEEIGVTTARPPLQPVPLGALAGTSHMPLQRTPMHQKHRQLGATMVELGPWQRAYSYGSPHDEVLAVRQRVGIIDVSTLGKLDVKGRDAPALLDKVYTHHFSNLRVGRIRYGILCTDSGMILDDGTVMRMADDHYFVTTTTGNVELIEEWFKWWMAGTGMCAHVTNVTSTYAAINVAGPKARETLRKLTEVDLDPEAFHYMRSKEGMVAGVPSIFLRIGFVGEAGWELHFPAEYGEYLWDVLMDAGKEFGIAPFGLEAQRILRLEKGHIIVNQDTDAVSNPLESNAEWAVRFDKEDFIGRGGLAWARERGLRNKLVGFVMKDGQVPKDGVPVVAADGTPIGRVTSSRLSPTTGKGFGLMWVPVEMAEDGRQINIMVDGTPAPADVALQPIYDPEGKRLRE